MWRPTMSAEQLLTPTNTDDVKRRTNELTNVEKMLINNNLKGSWTEKDQAKGRFVIKSDDENVERVKNYLTLAGWEVFESDAGPVKNCRVLRVRKPAKEG